MNSINILKKAKAENFYCKLIQQLKKDFTLANIDINIVSEEMEPSALNKIVHEKIYYLILEKFNEYLNLLYVIDIPEKAFKNIEVTDVVDVASQVTQLIFNRQLQKVKWKAKYS